MIAILFLLMYINTQIESLANLKPPQESLLLIDIKNILYGVFVGLIFSFLLSLQNIREFILKSVSNFMTDDGYLSKLEKQELERLKDKVFSVLHGVDLVSNEQSLFHYVKKLDQFLSTPHKSIVNEFWSIDYWKEDPNLFLTKRIQEYRVHSLDLANHNKFDVVYKYSLNVHDETHLPALQDHFNLVLEANGERYEVKNLKDKNPMLIKNDYNQVSKVYEVYIKQQVDLKEEYTKIHMVTERIEEIDDSIAVVSNHATYGMNYAIYLPSDFIINNVFHHDTLYSEKEKQVSVVNDGNKVAIDVNGWHLPGLIFVLSYNRKNN